MEREQFDNDDVLKNIIRKGGLEQPSFDFTQSIMAKIQSPQHSAVYLYQPVISKKVWIFLSVVVAGLFVFILLAPASQSSSTYDVTKYITPVQNIFSEATSGFVQKLSFINSLSWMVVVIAAGWLLFAADKLLGKTVMAE